MYVAEMFCIELKFTNDSLKFWFEKKIKPRFLELDYTQKDNFRKENPITCNTFCSICDFPINPLADKGWLDHIIESEYLFLKNKYGEDQMKKMEIENLEDYSNNIYRFINHFE